ncbi:MAG: sigma-70 family RNA polymerase sigma factor [Candidatus Zixiibacteriota bacterium]|nr:MAG: sigma-70 family RNA polymerase sigma factor [candidate division Zixibacteria bacterium]
MRESVSVIWQRVLTGSSEDWTKLVTRYASLVYSVVLRFGLTGDDAADCAQQTWIALYKSRESIKDPTRLPSWLIRVASRKASRMVRRRAKELRALGQLAAESTVPPPEDDLIRLQERAQLNHAFEHLDDRCQEVLRAVFFAAPKKSYAEIATDMGIPVNSLGPTRIRCIKKLRRILEDLEGQ